MIEGKSAYQAQTLNVPGSNQVVWSTGPSIELELASRLLCAWSVGDDSLPGGDDFIVKRALRLARLLIKESNKIENGSGNGQNTLPS